MRTFRVFWRGSERFTDFVAKEDGMVWMYQNEETSELSKHRAVAAFPKDALDGVVIPELVYPPKT